MNATTNAKPNLAIQMRDSCHIVILLLLRQAEIHRACERKLGQVRFATRLRPIAEGVLE
jgi:hypothetical protein